MKKAIYNFKDNIKLVVKGTVAPDWPKCGVFRQALVSKWIALKEIFNLAAFFKILN